MRVRRIRLYFTQEEIRDLIISVLVLALVFTLVFSSLSIIGFAIFAAIVALSFIPHELGHKFAAIKAGCDAHYKMWLYGLLLALLFSFLGFVFAAPGAVMISAWGKRLSSKETAMISATGPGINLVIASVGAALLLLLPVPTLPLQILLFVVKVNAILAFFNLLPIPPLDGAKIIWASLPLWLVMIVLAGGLWFTPLA